MSQSECLQCDAAIKTADIERRSVAFPCPSCGSQLQLPDWWIMLNFYGGIATPPLTFWALGLSWPQFLIAELVFAYPVLWVLAHYSKYVWHPNLVFAIPRPRLGSRTELNLRDRPRS